MFKKNMMAAITAENKFQKALASVKADVIKVVTAAAQKGRKSESDAMVLVTLSIEEFRAKRRLDPCAYLGTAQVELVTEAIKTCTSAMELNNLICDMVRTGAVNGEKLSKETIKALRGCMEPIRAAV